MFDGRGREFRAQVEAAARGRVRVELLEPIVPAPEMRVPLTLVQAVLKGDKMDAVVRDATMMGVAAIEPIITSRTIGRGCRATTTRWGRVAVASAKQCRRAVVPAIAEACDLFRLADSQRSRAAACCWSSHQRRTAVREVMRRSRRHRRCVCSRTTRRDRSR